MSRHRLQVRRLWSDDTSIRLATLAIGGGIAGCLGSIGALSSAFLLIAIGAFVLVGPGGLLMSWYADLPAEAVYALVPVVGLSVGILIVSGLLMGGVYAPLPILLGMAVTTLAGGILRRRQLVAREVSTP